MGLRVVVIPARYGSTRFPGKPLVKIKGKPMIRWVYERAVSSRLAHRVVVATDHPEIKKCVEEFGGEAILTPHCPTGSDRVAYVAEHFGEGWDFVVNLQGDEPLVPPEAIDRVFEALKQDPAAVVTLATEIEDDSEYRDPNVVKVVFDREGYALYFSRSPIPYMRENGTAYKHIGIYGYGRDTLLRFVKMERGRWEEAESLEQLRALEGGIPVKVLITEYRGIGVDVPEDVEKVEKLLVG